MAQMHHLMLAAAIACASGCTRQSVADVDGAYYAWDGARVLCGVGLDDVSGNSVDSFAEGMDRAVETGAVLVVFGHKPGVDHDISKLEAVLSAADQRGLRYLTFGDLVDPDTQPGAGIALTFDDSGVDHWYETRALLAEHAARVTYFVTRFHQLSDARIDKLRDLRADGHAVEAHSRDHVDAPDYVEEYGMRAYLDEQLIPSLDVMREAGFEPRSFAYPFGARTSALDAAILEHVELVRSVSWTLSSPLIADPCP